MRGETQGEFESINPRIDTLENKIVEMDRRLTVRMESLSEKVDVVRDIERLKVEVAELKRQRQKSGQKRPSESRTRISDPT